MLERLYRFFAAVNPSGLGMMRCSHALSFSRLCYSVTLGLPHRHVFFGSSPNIRANCVSLASSMNRIRQPLHKDDGRSLPKRRSTAHDVLYWLLLKPPVSDRPVQCLTITAVQRRRDTQSLSVITAELRPVKSTIADLAHNFTATLPVCPFRWRAAGFRSTAHSGA